MIVVQYVVALFYSCCHAIRRHLIIHVLMVMVMVMVMVIVMVILITVVMTK